MNYKQAKQYIQSTASFGSVYGLKSIEELLKRLGNPQDQLVFVHIAGTNGKGSTLAFLNSVLIESGYIVGRYSSPALIDYREVIQVNKQYIDKRSLTNIVATIKKVVDEMVAEGLAHPTKFEMEAALAFLYFLEKECDIVLLETGLGGLLDATNIVKTTIVSIISSISMDHMDILGNSIEEIAYQKAGIIKEKTDVVTCSQSNTIIDVIHKESEYKNASLFIADIRRLQLIFSDYHKQIFNYETLHHKEYKNLEISLVGLHQLDNAMLAIETIERLRHKGYRISDRNMYQGLRNASWFGRFTIVKEHPLVILDGAHNKDAARRLRDNLELYFKDRRKVFIIGIFKDKDYQSIIDSTCDLADCIVVIDNKDHQRLFRSKELTKIIEKTNPHVVSSLSIKDAYHKAIINAFDDDVIVCFGSLSFLGEIKEVIEEGGNHDK